MMSTSNKIDPASSATILKSLVSRRKRQWTQSFLLILVVALAIAFFVFPQSYNSTVSIAMQQPSTATGSLTSLLSMGSVNRKYLGVLKSRSFVDMVEKVAGLKQLYELKRKSDVYEKYSRSVKFDDNVNDGLIYISITLDAPPLLMWGQDARRRKVRDTAAVIGNEYHKALLYYLINVDSDKELVLLRSADSEVLQSRLNYDVAVNRLSRFVRSQPMKPTALPDLSAATSMLPGSSGGAGGQDATSAATQFLALFTRKAQLEAQVVAADTLHERLTALLHAPLAEIAAIPGEDPLLFEARKTYNDSVRTYENLKAQLGPENPRLVSAKSNAQIAEQRLRNQIKSVLDGNTTEHLNLASLKSTYNTVSRQVGDAEKNFQTSRELTTTLGRLTSEVALNLKVLETAKTAAESLKMSTVAARNRMNVVDEASPEDRSHPGKGMMIVVSLLIAGFVVGLWAAVEYNLSLKAADEALLRSSTQS